MQPAAPFRTPSRQRRRRRTCTARPAGGWALSLADRNVPKPATAHSPSQRQHRKQSIDVTVVDTRWCQHPLGQMRVR